MRRLSMILGRKSTNNNNNNNNNNDDDLNNNNNNIDEPQTRSREEKGKGEEKQKEKVYERSAQLVKDRINTEDLAVLKSVGNADVVVVSGSADQIEQVLQLIQVPHVVISPQQLPLTELRPSQTVYMNCHPAGYNPSVVDQIRSFVKKGGQLITTDYVLNTLLQQAFPEFVRYDGASTSDTRISIKCAQVEDAVLSAFKNEESWWLAGGSHPITIVDENRVDVLISSNDLKTFNASTAVLIKFHLDQGVVYHMISHFKLQHGAKAAARSEDTNAAQYARQKGATEETVKTIDEDEKAGYQYDYADIQNAATTTEFVYKCAIEQKKKFK